MRNCIALAVSARRIASRNNSWICLPISLAAQIRVTVRKVWVSLSGSYPHAALFAQVSSTLEKGKLAT